VPGEQVAAGGGGVATIPAAPAGVGAPALSSATRLIPLAEPDEISIRALKPSTNGQNGVEGPANGTVVTPEREGASPPPSTAAGGGNGVARPPAPVPMPTMPTMAGAAPIGAPAGPPAPPPRVALPRQSRPPVSPPPTGRRAARGSSGRRVSPVFFVLAGILAVAVIAAVLVFVAGSGNSSPSSSSSSASNAASATTATRTAKGKHRSSAASATVTPSAVTVAVLNGTSTNNLAADVLGKLTAAGYKGGSKQNAAETGVTSTIVGYTSPSDRSDALAVAKSLNLGPASVQAVSQGDRLKVCGSTGACTTQVVVTAGDDLAQAG
jgi:hypothetical protein